MARTAFSLALIGLFEVALGLGFRALSSPRLPPVEVRVRLERIAALVESGSRHASTWHAAEASGAAETTARSAARRDFGRVLAEVEDLRSYPYLLQAGTDKLRKDLRLAEEAATEAALVLHDIGVHRPASERGS